MNGSLPQPVLLAPPRSPAFPGGFRQTGHGIARLPAFVFVALIRLYQRTLSPVLPIVTLGRCTCRFAPTCSHYAVEAISTHGAWRGSWLAACRLAKCTPLHSGGFDPVPNVAVRSRPACHRTA